MITGPLVDAVLGGVLGGGRKRSRRARRYLTGHRGGLWSNPNTLLTAAGVAWGVFETLQRSEPQSAARSASSGQPASASVADLPPVPGVLDAGPAGGVETGDPALRLVRLAISAANADGAMNDQERAAIVQKATDAGMADVAARELSQPRPVGEIVAGVIGIEESATLYVLAFAILRADEQLTATERIYLAQLANLLRLDRATAEALEKDTGDRIDALGDQAQPGD
jgi:uncharacterized membrane protein YebE (DUF533 family)